MIRRTVSAAVALATLALVSAAPVVAQTVPKPASPTPSPAAAAGAITAPSAILVSLGDDGRMLFGRGVHAPRAPASLTKIVTALVARDEYALDDVVKISPLVLQATGSKLDLEPGMSVTVHDLLYGLLLKSGNDVAMALAAHHPLGFEHFIALMNSKARSLGATDSFFRNPHGLDEPGHVSSAWDMAIFARQLLADPVLAQIVATHRYSIPWKNGTRRVFDNHNKLLTRYPGTIGVKTGFTVQAGHCLVAANQTPDGILLAVVMGSQDHYKDTTALLNYGKALELGQAGGGGFDTGTTLATPPPPPADVVAAAAAGPISDARDDVRWVVLMVVLAAMTASTLAFRRRRAPTASSDVYAWLESLAERSSSRDYR
jgi:D-alanyl-D-alanine carboxypeptidase